MWLDPAKGLLQPLVWPSNFVFFMLSGCDWWISIPSVNNTQKTRARSLIVKYTTVSHNTPLRGEAVGDKTARWRNACPCSLHRCCNAPSRRTKENEEMFCASAHREFKLLRRRRRQRRLKLNLNFTYESRVTLKCLLCLSLSNLSWNWIWDTTINSK